MTEKNPYSMHLINEETSVEQTRQIEVTLPKWAWEILHSRAIYHHGGHLKKAIEEVFGIGFQSLMQSITHSVSDVPEDKNKFS